MVGKQIQVAMNLADEREFLSFLRSCADIALLESFAPTERDLWVTEFNPELNGHWHYSIWNTTFAWQPHYGTVGPKSHDPGHVGWKYVSNTGAAPVLEVRRSNPAGARFGRLYWANNFSSSRALQYDTQNFRNWIESIWRWVRKNGLKDHRVNDGPYFLPGALCEWRGELPNISINRTGEPPPIK
jgi:hypothetical protein